MVAGTHPDEIELFDYVEDDLPQARRTEVEGHLSTCTACAKQVRRVQAGRDALRQAQLLHLPERRREGIIANLSTQERERGRRRALSPKLLIAVLTPVIAIAAVIGVLVSSNSNPSSESAAVAGQTAAGASGGGGVESAPCDRSTSPTTKALALSTQGPAADVASELQSKGFDAIAKGNRVGVKGASKKAVRQALADRPCGDVVIVIGGR
jgi:Putative zinc-finger